MKLNNNQQENNQFVANLKPFPADSSAVTLFPAEHNSQDASIHPDIYSPHITIGCGGSASYAKVQGFWLFLCGAWKGKASCLSPLFAPEQTHKIKENEKD